MSGVVEPLLKPFETSEPPHQWDVLESSLKRFVDAHVPIENDAELRKRERVMDELKGVFQQWVFSVCRSKGLSEDLARAAGGKIYTSGSYRLRVHEPGADIDSVGVAPKHCGRDDFFSTFKSALQAHPLVENLRSIESAVVPIMTFDMDGVNIDMLFAQLPLNEVPDALDIDDDGILHSVDEATEKSLNGPRVTNLIYKLVAHNYDSFLQVLRMARIWGKRRGIYSNKMGYLGGVNFNILVALICQLFPRATPAYLLCKFFHIFAQWNWPSPAILCRPVDHRLGFEVWNPNHHLYGRAAAEHARANLMPIVTPAYPAMNSAANVNPWTFKVIKDEFERASQICKDIEAVHLYNPDPPLRKSQAELAQEWERLIEPSDFFARYDTYLAINLLDTSAQQAATPGAFDEFKAYISSRLRKLVERLGYLPFSQVHLFPREFNSATAFIEGARLAASYFVGVVEDSGRLREGESLVLTHVWTGFWEKEVARFRGLADYLDLRLEHLRWSKLPDFVFGAAEERALIRRQRARRQREEEDRRALEHPNNQMHEEDFDAAQEIPIAPPVPAPATSNDDMGDVETSEPQEDAEDGPLTFWNLPDSLPTLRPVLPKWHPMAKKENREHWKRKITFIFLPNSPEMIEQRRQEFLKARKQLNIAVEPSELLDKNFLVDDSDAPKSPMKVFRATLGPNDIIEPKDESDDEDGDEINANFMDEDRVNMESENITGRKRQGHDVPLEDVHRRHMRQEADVMHD